VTSKPSRRSMAASTLRRFASSSMTRTFAMGCWRGEVPD
jgi:hypothetical protein